ncbi:sulfurase [Sulfitobacter sp. D35]|uniref:MOSC domain-containing protein n=1 Tax=Sulfitobacter sp. D35 TaxID=3083252 RepID=UPI00296FA8CF|nr:sulfurase [Sulfitobacter sp. D35]MDW4499500.1 sulfurase [Sulfitobacter sp. D35]
MPALKPTDFTATVTWLGRVADSETTLRAEPLEQAFLGFAGIEGECHGGLTRRSCSRVTSQYPRGTKIRNVRQLSVLSDEEMALIAQGMKLDRLDPAQVGASMVIRGIPDFSHVPPSSRLQFSSGATITIDMENRPCVLPGREIDKDAPGHGPAFKTSARGLRGVTAWIEREGSVAVGDTARLHVPDQPAWTQMQGLAG